MTLEKNTFHNLELKIGLLIDIFLRNLELKKCNKTRMSIKKLMSNVIVKKVLTGNVMEKYMLIPKIN